MLSAFAYSCALCCPVFSAFSSESGAAELIGAGELLRRQLQGSLRRHRLHGQHWEWHQMDFCATVSGTLPTSGCNDVCIIGKTSALWGKKHRDCTLLAASGDVNDPSSVAFSCSVTRPYGFRFSPAWNSGFSFLHPRKVVEFGQIPILAVAFHSVYPHLCRTGTKCILDLFVPSPPL